MNIPVIYEDEWLLVVDKPAGLLSIPSPKNESRTLTSILNEDLKSRNIPWRLHPCHRLDKDTSGLMIYAKGKAVQKKMMLLFKDKLIKKTYLAFVHGNLKKETGEIKTDIGGLAAQTKFRVVAGKSNFSVVEVEPLTGKTNQIRIHFKYLNHPLVGETKFVFRKDFTLRAKRLMLHAKSLNFLHPITGKPINLTSPFPGYFEQFLKEHN
ncbi:MAG: RluA family pseudouridine synthase [Candidatus Omnitrophota bacterium]